MKGRGALALIVVGLALVALAICQQKPSPEAAAPATTAVVVVTTAQMHTTTTHPSDVVPLAPRPHEEGHPEIEGRGTDTVTAQRWPLVRSLPKTTTGWRIDYRIDAEQLVLVVTLRPVLNHGHQLERYRTDLRRYKAEALDWLRSVGANPAESVIEWRPQEAAAL